MKRVLLILSVAICMTEASLPLTSLFKIDEDLISPKNINKIVTSNNAKNIFTLLADIDPAERRTAYDDPIAGNVIPDREYNLNDINRVFDPDFNIESDLPTKRYLGMLKSIGHSVLVAADVVMDIKGTVEKASNIYEKQKLKTGDKTLKKRSVMDALLDPSIFEHVIDIGVSSKNEDETLEQLTDVIIGAEDRSYGGLTLDPVTVIALLTLAAYLIRAVYQIIVVTGARSMDDGDLLAYSDMPEAMVKLHNIISSTDMFVDREAREMKEKEYSLTGLPGEISAMMKLHKENDEACFKKFLCERLKGIHNPFSRMADAMIASLGIVYGDRNALHYFDMNKEDSCDAMTTSPCPFDGECSCSSKHLKEATRLQSLYARAIDFFGAVLPKTPSVIAWKLSNAL